MPFIRSRRQTLTDKTKKEVISVNESVRKDGISVVRLTRNLFRDKLYPYIYKLKNLYKDSIKFKIRSVTSHIKQEISPQMSSYKNSIKEKLYNRFKLIKSVFKDRFLDKNIPDENHSSDSKVLPSPFKEWSDHSSSLSQGRHWSSTIIALCSTMFVGSLLWAFTARIDQTITVRGRLQPSGSVREVESPSAGVVSKVYINDGDVVKAGQPLFIVEAKGLSSRRSALNNTLAIYDVQANSLKNIIDGGGDPSKINEIPELPIISDPSLSAKLITARQQSQLILSQLSQISYRIESREKTLKLQQQIAEGLKPLYEAGAIARNQYLNKLNQVQEVRADAQSLKEERIRILGQAASQLNQLNTQMIQMRSELVNLQETLDYRTVKAPIDGKIFDAKVSPYSVVSGGSIVLKIVPDNRLEATVKIGNSDIGFVKVGMPVNVSVDSFPSGEFGYLEGTLKSIGLDALPPSQSSPDYSFPATVTLKQQEVESGGKLLNLQSGMSVNANIKLRSRPVITILTDLFTKQIEGVSRFR